MRTEYRTYRVELKTVINITVELNAESEDDAADQAWEQAEDYLRTLVGDMSAGRKVMVDTTLDGIGAHAVVELPE